MINLYCVYYFAVSQSTTLSPILANNLMKYRTGYTGALMDTYEKAANDLIQTLETIHQTDFETIVDQHTDDPDCRSIQTIMNHVVRSGYGYSNYLRRAFNEPFTERKEQYELTSPQKAIDELKLMLVYSEQFFEHKQQLTYEEAMAYHISSLWGQEYDFEQLMEHAIVHVMRHHRQIARFLLQLQATR